MGGTSSGDVYTWGRGDYGQLGPPPPDQEGSDPVIGRLLDHSGSSPPHSSEEDALIDIPKYR